MEFSAHKTALAEQEAAQPAAAIAQMRTPYTPTSIAAAVGQACGIWQTTIAQPVSCKGIGLHSGTEAHLKIRPAGADTGIVFIRTDIKNRAESIIPALFTHVCQVTLHTVIGNHFGHSVGTVEHLMAALSGMGIDHAFIEIDGPEVPVMDGSAKVFVDLLTKAGKTELARTRRMICITRPVRVEAGDHSCALLPDSSCVFEAEIDFDNPIIGKQAARIDLVNDGFSDKLAQARTFGMLEDVQSMHSAGLALGGSLKNAIVLDGDKVLNEEGLRSPDEFVLHKLLDAVGDLYLAGLRIIGRYQGVKSGHAQHNKLLHALFSRQNAFEIVSLEQELGLVVAAE